MRLVDYYYNNAPDDSGRLLSEAWAMTDAALERTHTLIQYLFPLPERSTAQPRSPVLTPEELERFRTDPVLLDNVRISLGRLRDFYTRTAWWTRASDHNHLRITRILRCLTLFGLHAEAAEFHAWLLEQDTLVSERSRWFWREALSENPAFLGSDTRPPT